MINGSAPAETFGHAQGTGRSRDNRKREAEASPTTWRAIQLYSLSVAYVVAPPFQVALGLLLHANINSTFATQRRSFPAAQSTVFTRKHNISLMRQLF